MSCPGCGSPVGANAAVCPSCGRLIDRPTTTTHSKSGNTALAVLGALLGGIFVGPAIGVPLILLNASIVGNPDIGSYQVHLGAAFATLLVLEALLLAACLVAGVRSLLAGRTVVAVFILTTGIVAALPVAACDGFALLFKH